ncbi:hypothetical protein D3C78_1031660 [compost metagenome]
MDEDGILGRLEDRPVAGLGLKTLQFGGGAHREDAQDRLDPAMLGQRTAVADGDQPQRPTVAGEQRVAGIAVNVELTQVRVGHVAPGQATLDQVEALAEHLGTGRAGQRVADVLPQLAGVIQRQGGQLPVVGIAEPADEGEVGLQRARQITHDGLEHLIAGGGRHPQRDMAQRFLDALAVADVGGDAAHGDDPALRVEQRELAGQIDPASLTEAQLLLELHRMATAGHAEVVGTQGVGDRRGEQFVIAAPQHLLGAQPAEALEGRIDQAVAAVQVLDVDHRAAVVDDLPQRMIEGAGLQGRSRPLHGGSPHRLLVF